MQTKCGTIAQEIKIMIKNTKQKILHQIRRHLLEYVNTLKEKYKVNTKFTTVNT